MINSKNTHHNASSIKHQSCLNKTKRVFFNSLPIPKYVFLSTHLKQAGAVNAWVHYLWSSEASMQPQTTASHNKRLLHSCWTSLLKWILVFQSKFVYSDQCVELRAELGKNSFRSGASTIPVILYQYFWLYYWISSFLKCTKTSKTRFGNFLDTQHG